MHPTPQRPRGSVGHAPKVEVCCHHPQNPCRYRSPTPNTRSMWILMRTYLWWRSFVRFWSRCIVCLSQSYKILPRVPDGRILSSVRGRWIGASSIQEPPTPMLQIVCVTGRRLATVRSPSYTRRTDTWDGMKIEIRHNLLGLYRILMRVLPLGSPSIPLSDGEIPIKIRYNPRRSL